MNVHHHVGGEDEIGAGIRLAGESIDDLGHGDFGINPGQAGAFDHARRQVEADDFVHDLCEGARCQASAAAEVDGAREGRRPDRRGARDHHRGQQQRRPAIAEIVHQCRIESRRILVEQRLDVGRPHG